MKFCPEIYTEKLDECIRFYCDYLHFEIKQRLEGFVVLRNTQNPEYEIMFCVPNSPFVDKIFRPPFKGQGLIFQLEINDSEAEYARLQSLSVPIALPLTEEPINGKHFTITDPNGIFIDIVEFV